MLQFQLIKAFSFIFGIVVVLFGSFSAALPLVVAEHGQDNGYLNNAQRTAKGKDMRVGSARVIVTMCWIRCYCCCCVLSVFGVAAAVQ